MVRDYEAIPIVVGRDAATARVLKRGAPKPPYFTLFVYAQSLHDQDNLNDRRFYCSPTTVEKAQLHRQIGEFIHRHCFMRLGIPIRAVNATSLLLVALLTSHGI